MTSAGHRLVRTIGLACWSAASIVSSGCQWRTLTTPTPVAGISIPTIFRNSGSPIVVVGPPALFIVRQSGQMWIQVLIRANGIVFGLLQLGWVRARKRRR